MKNKAALLILLLFAFLIGLSRCIQAVSAEDVSLDQILSIRKQIFSLKELSEQIQPPDPGPLKYLQAFVMQGKALASDFSELGAYQVQKDILAKEMDPWFEGLSKSLPPLPWVTAQERMSLWSNLADDFNQRMVRYKRKYPRANLFIDKKTFLSRK